MIFYMNLVIVSSRQYAGKYTSLDGMGSVQAQEGIGSKVTTW